ncbi:MAG TPA: N-6 DNA methylase [Longimicrobium sp.]
MFEPDAYWRSSSAITVYFKYSESEPDERTVSTWHKEIWNEGASPLLWVVSREQVKLYNGFSRPESEEDASRHLLRVFNLVDEQLAELDQFAGRYAMETGQFWLHSEDVDRKTGVDAQLLQDLASLERDLLAHLARPAAQALIGRAIFTQYLVDRRIVDGARLRKECGETTLQGALKNPAAADRLFGWLAATFNGDMFPESVPADPTSLSRVADFLDGYDAEKEQLSFFPYRFDVIPVELISLIYEQFAHSIKEKVKKNSDEDVEEESEAKKLGLHYTRLPVVSLILDEVLDGVSGDETILDLTCGSGVFLVEALRRLVAAKGEQMPSRAVIREILYNQVFGVDISDAAIRVAAFSLYLAALELDPNPQPPEALKFEALIGRTLLVGDARDIETTRGGAPLLQDGIRRKFDVIVGNPPWTFKGKAGSQERRNRVGNANTTGRGEAFDFLTRAAEFGDGGTRYGIILSATPFFASSRSAGDFARTVVERFAPVTLVNLSAHTGWLFPTATMPAMVFLARHRPQDPKQIVVVNVPWSRSSERSHALEIAPDDVSTLRLSEWNSEPKSLKTAFLGRGRDVLLLNSLRARHQELKSWLTSVNSEWCDGLILGKEAKRSRDASELAPLPFLESKALARFRVPSGLPTFGRSKAEWPRDRETYRAPLLLIKEFLRSDPRPVTAVAEEDVVFTDAYFGASLPQSEIESAHLLAAILGSALSAWFFLLTGAELGVFKRRLLTSDVGALPIPNVDSALQSAPGRRLLELERRYRTGEALPDWGELDNAVFDLYGLDALDRIVVMDGVERLGWQWKAGRNASAESASVAADLVPYAEVFLEGIDAWLRATGRRHISAEVLDIPHRAPLRVVRFVLGDGRREPFVRVLPAGGDLAAVLDSIGRRLRVPLGEALVGTREIRVHGADEVIVIKPASRRFWMRGAALADADAVVSESFTGVAP